MAHKLLTRLLRKIVRNGTLTITYHDGTYHDGIGDTLGSPSPGFPDVAIRFADTKVPRDLIRDMRLGAGEAYMDGRILIERGDVMELVQLLRANTPWEKREVSLRPSLIGKVKSRLGYLAKAVNRPGSARRNVSHHYDIGNDLYRLMLDAPHMQYSCAYWPREDMTLEQAQEAKLAHIAAKLSLEPGARVLDIGCGWGGMAIYLARHCDVRVHGVTLSGEQLALAEERAAAAGLSDRITFELVDYRDLARRGERYDRIVSVGMFEHVGRPQFETFFRACAHMLAPEGVMLLHTIGRMGQPGSTDAFTNKYIFPGGYIPALSETLAASEKARLIATDIETLRLHYARTLRAWYARCLDHRAEIVAAYGDRFFRMWTFYLAGATAAFESGGLCNYQIQYARQRRALPLTRDYLARDEAALTVVHAL